MVSGEQGRAIEDIECCKKSFESQRNCQEAESISRIL
jgi:hypothetical protein